MVREMLGIEQVDAEELGDRGKIPSLLRPLTTRDHAVRQWWLWFGTFVAFVCLIVALLGGLYYNAGKQGTCLPCAPDWHFFSWFCAGFLFLPVLGWKQWELGRTGLKLDSTPIMPAGCWVILPAAFVNTVAFAGGALSDSKGKAFWWGVSVFLGFVFPGLVIVASSIYFTRSHLCCQCAARVQPIAVRAGGM